MNEDLFDSYLLNQLSNSEKKDFEKKIKEDESFHIAFVEHKKAVDAIQIESMDSLKAELKSFHSEKYGSEKKNKLVFLIVGILLLASAIWFFINKQAAKETLNPQQLYASHYEDFPLPGTLRNDTSDNLSVVIQKDYESGNYTNVVQFLNSKDNKEINLHYRLILGCSQMQVKEFGLAEQNFEIVRKSGNPKYEHIGSWYLALLKIKNEKLTEAKTILNELSQKESFYAKKAKELLLMI